MIVVHVRGTCGSGKTTLLRGILADERGDWTGPPRERFSVAWNLQVLDHDGIPVVGQTIPAIWNAVQLRRNVLIQGIYHSNQKQCWLDLAAQLKASDNTYYDCYLSTSLEECERRVLERRARANNHRPYDVKNMRGIYKNVQRRFAEMSQAGHEPIWLPVEQPEQAVRDLLGLPRSTVVTSQVIDLMAALKESLAKKKETT